MPARLIITDGTDEINLLQLPGFHLNSWRPSIAGYKGGGTFQGSPLSDGRRLVDKRFENSFETFAFKARNVSQDALIRDLQDLRRMLEKAANYWGTDWQDEPVWIEARASQETNVRYGLIVQGRIPEDENPFAQPFLQPQCEAAMDNMTLVIERQHWTENEPGTGTAVELSALETYDGRNLGNVDSTGTRDPTTDAEVFIANKRNEANLTDVYVDNGGVFGSNLMDAALPFNLLPATPAVDDAVYFGIDSTLADSGPFNNLIFDIGTAITNVTGIAWEYYDGAAWVALAIQDNTNNDGVMAGVAFDTTGVRSVHWEHPTDWTTTDVNSITAYWVRARVSGIGVGPTAPTQRNRDVYTVTWPYVEFQAAQIGGDVPALARITLSIQSDTDGLNPVLSTTNRVIVGLRSISRGANFTAYLNFADEQNPDNVAADTHTGVFSSFITDINAWCSTGRCIEVINAPANGIIVANIEIDYPLTLEYHGKFHAFIRAYQTTGSAGDVSIQLYVNDGYTPSVAVSDTVPFVNAQVELLDLGVITINSSDCEESGRVIFSIFATGDAAADFNLYDLVLIPVDEWAADCVDWVKQITGATSSLLKARQSVEYNSYLDISGLCIKQPGSVLRRVNNDRKIIRYQYISSGTPIVQPNARQRLWFTSVVGREILGGTAVEWTWESTPSYIVNLYRSQRYLSARGDR